MRIVNGDQETEGGGGGPTPAAVAEPQPLVVRANVGRLNVALSRLAYAFKLQGNLIEWMKLLPEVVGESDPAAEIRERIVALGGIVDAIPAKWKIEGRAPAETYNELLENAAECMELAEIFQRAAMLLVRNSLASLALNAEVKRLFERAGSRGTVVFALAKDVFTLARDIDAAATGLLIDSRWLASRSAAIEIDGLDPKRANAERVRRNRLRHRHGFGIVSTHYSQSDIETLRELGFLSGFPPYGPAAIAGAFEAFQQAALLVAQRVRQEEDQPPRSAGVWGLEAWAERLAALLRMGRRTER